MKNNERTLDTIILIINACLILILFLLFNLLWGNLFSNIIYFYNKGNWFINVVMICVVIYFNYIYGGFKLKENKLSEIIFSQILTLIITNLSLYFVVCVSTKRLVIIFPFMILLFVQVIFTLIFNSISKYFTNKFFPARNTLIIYDKSNGDVDTKLTDIYNNMFKVSKIIEIKELKDIPSYQSYEYIVLYKLSTVEKENLLIRFFDKNLIVYIIPSLGDILTNNMGVSHIIDTPMLISSCFGPSQTSRIVKRIIDFTISLTACILLSPLMILVYFAIKVFDGGPAIYKQERVTLHGKSFNIYKFRSMVINAEVNGEAKFATKNDNRITPIGKIIRKFRLDELPQLFNILKGDMSIVGPRPERPEIISDIKKDLPEFDFRLKVKAGLTGYAQVYGKYNTKLEDKLLLDLIYIQNYSIVLDFKIMFLTVKSIFSSDSTEGY